MTLKSALQSSPQSNILQCIIECIFDYCIFMICVIVYVKDQRVGVSHVLSFPYVIELVQL